MKLEQEIILGWLNIFEICSGQKKWSFEKKMCVE